MVNWCHCVKFQFMIITLGSIQALHKRVMGGLAKLADTAYASHVYAQGLNQFIIMMSL